VARSARRGSGTVTVTVTVTVTATVTVAATVTAREALIRARNADLAKQLDRACDSVHQNLAEARGRWGDDRTRMFRIAYGSLREVRGSLELAVIKGWLDGSEPAHGIAHRLGGLLYRLAKL
jgi:four helix bundle protein